MKLLEIVNRVLCILCAVIGAFCLGYAIVTGTGHVFITATVFFLLAFLIEFGARSDRKREEEQRKNNWRD